MSDATLLDLLHSRLEPRSCRLCVTSPERVQPKRSARSDGVEVVMDSLGDLQSPLRVRPGLGPSKHRLDQAEPG